MQDNFKSILPDWFKIWPHQQNMWNLVLNQTLKGVENIEGYFSWSRRTGKDVTAMALLAVMMQINPGRYFHVFNTQEDARRNMWRGMLNEPPVKYISLLGVKDTKAENDALGIRVLDKEMSVFLPNGSEYKLLGADEPNKLRGAGAKGFVFSEAEFYNSDEVFKVVGPMLGASKGFAIFISTPNGQDNPGAMIKDNIRNRYLKKKEPNVFFEKLTIKDCEKLNGFEIVSDAFLENEKLKWGEDYVRREYFCDESAAIDNTYYGDLMRQMEEDGRICELPIHGDYMVHTAWDIGQKDPTAIIYFQLINNWIHIIDYDEMQSSEITGPLALIKNKRYNYEHHLAPWDIEIKHTTGSPIMVAAQNGVHFKVVKTNTTGVQVGINMCRTLMPRVKIDSTKCERLIRALKNYKKKLSPGGAHQGKAVHDKYSHPSDAFRTMGVGINEYGLHGIMKDETPANRFAMGATVPKQAMSWNKRNFAHVNPPKGYMNYGSNNKTF